MKTVKRLDLFQEKFKNVTKTDAGFLRFPIRATRVGIFKYLMPDGSIRRELRPPEEVFDEDSMATLAAVPITIKHPSELVTTENFSLHSVGLTGDQVVAVEDRFLDVFGTVGKKRAVDMIEDKIKKGDSQEVSCGYACEMEEKSGVWEGERYDAIQRNIRYNHVALVNRGRAGHEVKLRLDGDQAITYDKNIKIGEDSMEKVTINGKTFEVEADLAKVLKADAQESIELDGEKFDVSPALAKAIKKSMKGKGEEKKKMDELEDEIKELKKKNDTIEAKKDSLEDEVKELKEKTKSEKMDADEIDALVEERSSVCETAKEVIGEEFKKDGLSNLEIKKQVIAKINPDLKLDEKSEDYVNARFDAISENTEIYEDKLKKALERKDGKDTKETKTDAASARARMIAESQEAYKQPLTKTKA